MQNKGKKRKDSERKCEENAKKMRRKCEENAKFQSSLCKVFVHVCVFHYFTYFTLKSLLIYKMFR